MAYRNLSANDFSEQVIDELLERLAEGVSLRVICSDRSRMPDRRTIQRWMEKDDELAAEIARAREVGFRQRGEQAVEDAKNASDAALGRLAFDAERWYLGKLSNAFADKPVQVEAKTTVTLDADDIFGKFAGALERAATTIASSAGGTIRVAEDGAPGTDRT